MMSNQRDIHPSTYAHLFQQTDKASVEMLKGFVQYMLVTTVNVVTSGMVIFSRRSLKEEDFPDWGNSPVI